MHRREQTFPESTQAAFAVRGCSYGESHHTGASALSEALHSARPATASSDASAGR